jgi:uncharacterized damage-inducible protein DinB
MVAEDETEKNMSELVDIVRASLANEYREKARNVHKWADPLTDEQFWRNPYGYGNSVGHLVLHLTGNLRYYIGTRIAQTGYVRNRDLEFTDTARRPKAEVLRAFDETIEMVVATIEKQSGSDWTLPYAAEREPEAKDRFTAIMRCAVHLYHHVGQIIYLSRELRKD